MPLSLRFFCALSSATSCRARLAGRPASIGDVSAVVASMDASSGERDLDAAFLASAFGELSCESTSESCGDRTPRSGAEVEAWSTRLPRGRAGRDSSGVSLNVTESPGRAVCPSISSTSEIESGRSLGSSLRHASTAGRAMAGNVSGNTGGSSLSRSTRPPSSSGLKGRLPAIDSNRITPRE